MRRTDASELRVSMQPRTSRRVENWVTWPPALGDDKALSRPAEDRLVQERLHVNFAGVFVNPVPRHEVFVQFFTDGGRQTH